MLFFMSDEEGGGEGKVGNGYSDQGRGVFVFSSKSVGKLLYLKMF